MAYLLRRSHGKCDTFEEISAFYISVDYLDDLIQMIAESRGIKGQGN